jgi:hypothetical protein
MQRTQQRFAAFALSILLTLTLLVSVNHLATSQPPAGLVAQVAHAPAQS